MIRFLRLLAAMLALAARTRLADRREARAMAEVREIVDTDEWLVALNGGHSPRPYSDRP